MTPERFDCVAFDKGTLVIFESLDLGINERGEIILSPDRDMQHPTLFMSDRGSEIQVESIFHGPTEIPGLGHNPLGIFRLGLRLPITASKDKPIKIVVVNLGPEPSNISASLLCNPATPT